jgi:hypothetical protein
MPEDVEKQLFNIPRPGSPDITTSVAVFYIPGRHLKDGEFARGCHHFRRRDGDGRPEHLILLTDGAKGRVLAHELGHALRVSTK